LARLDELAELEPFVIACNELGAQIIALDQRIPLATQQLTAMWRAFQGSSILSGSAQEEAPQVTAARETVRALESERKRLVERAVVARSELETATVQLKAELLPAMAAQLAPPISTMIEGIDAAMAAERLLGPLGAQHAQARALVNVLVAYFRELRDALEKEN